MGDCKCVHVGEVVGCGVVVFFDFLTGFTLLRKVGGVVDGADNRSRDTCFGRLASDRFVENIGIRIRSGGDGLAISDFNLPDARFGLEVVK